MRKFAIVSKDDKESASISREIQKELFNSGLSYADSEPDIVCVVGGDGTFLSAIHKHIKRLDSVIFSGINTGTLGFFTDYTSDEVGQYIDDILNREPEIEKKRLLRIKTRGETNKNYLAVNEMRIENVIRTLIINIMINDRKLETIRGTGLCICTQAGSTAFNRSLKGAIVEPGLDIMELTEIAGIHHSIYRSLEAPIILSGDKKLKLCGDFDESTLLCFDRFAINMKGVREVECYLSDKTVSLAHFRPIDYIDRLYHLF
ncbi:MAG: NAD kinase [Erysipelotrichaceae bacterium]|nr:NAD kinase [Erysipelotrichaceae bacterium]